LFHASKFNYFLINTVLNIQLKYFDNASRKTMVGVWDLPYYFETKE